MTKSPENTAARVVIKAPLNTAYKSVLTLEAQAFLVELHSRFNETRKKLLTTRYEVQTQYDAGKQPDFCPETKHIRDDDSWHGAPLAPGLVDRRVEITGPVDRKLVINALNSGSTQFMADLEDSHTPTWVNCLEGQINLRDAVNGTIEYTSPEGKKYVLNDTKNLPIIVVRPRGWHLEDSNLEIDGKPISGSLFDFGLYFFHNAKKLFADARGPYFYIPKLESYLEARLWNDVFKFAQEAVGIPYGSIRATVLIETLPAAFQMEEIIYELRDHIAGLNAGRWDYIFSFIKKFINNPNMILPDRKQVTMTVPFMDAYSKLLIYACHRRGIHAMGGMSAFIPVRNAEENRLAFENVRADKEREATMGFDGTWVAHPGLISVALEVFNRIMPTKNQISNPGKTYNVSASDLLNSSIVGGKITEAGVRENITVSIQYMESWLRGIGCVPINNLMEDAATAEISRSQLYQWVKHTAPLDDSRILTFDLFKQFVFEQQSVLKARKLGTDIDKVTERATGILLKTVESTTFVEFILLECLKDLNNHA